MSIEQILKLCEAGFSKDDIMKLVTVSGEPAPEPAPEVPDPEPAPTPEPSPTTAADPTEPVNPPQDVIAAILTALQELKATIQTSNIKKSSQPDIAPRQSAEDIIREMLNPKPIENK